MARKTRARPTPALSASSSGLRANLVASVDAGLSFARTCCLSFKFGSLRYERRPPAANLHQGLRRSEYQESGSAKHKPTTTNRELNVESSSEYHEARMRRATRASAGVGKIPIRESPHSALRRADTRDHPLVHQVASGSGGTHVFFLNKPFDLGIELAIAPAIPIHRARHRAFAPARLRWRTPHYLPTAGRRSGHVCTRHLRADGCRFAL